VHIFVTICFRTNGIVCFEKNVLSHVTQFKSKVIWKLSRKQANFIEMLIAGNGVKTRMWQKFRNHEIQYIFIKCWQLN